MHLTDLVEYFRSGGAFEDFCAKHGLDRDAEVIEIFGVKPFDIDMDLAFFPVEETAGEIQHTANGVEYHNLFDFFFFLDAIEESKNEQNRAFSDRQIAEKLLAYAENNA
jgi:hypothetical protein